MTGDKSLFRKTSRAEDFLSLVERSRRGHLKLYIGFSAGVGKTYRMLEEAHALKKRGVDVVLGLIETHGRVETEALIRDLEVIPRHQIEYRGVVLGEMDVEAILVRRPQIVVVDELAHTNPPGSRHRKRHQDVSELLAAGINVIGAVNIQHLESLNDLVAKTSGVVVRETVPDSFLKQADQIVNLDLAVEDLLDRLKSGKIYPQERIEWALGHFFKDHNLSTLRELSLREVAESLDRTTKPETLLEGRTSSPNRIMVCISSSTAHAATLLRRASRMAGRLNTDWFAVTVETPSEDPRLIDAAQQRQLLKTFEMARELGAEVVQLKNRSPVQALVEFARSHGVGHIVLGRSSQARWLEWIRPSTMTKLIREANDFDLHIVPFDETGIET